MQNLRMPATKDISYDNEQLKIQNVPGQIMPMDIFVLFGYSLDKCNGKSFEKKFYSVGYEEGKRILSKLKHDTPPQLKIDAELRLNQLNITGLGLFKIIIFDTRANKFVVSVENSSYAIQYKVLFGFAKSPVDIFLCGMIAGAFGLMFGKEFSAAEKHCIAQGKTNCLFEVKTK